MSTKLRRRGGLTQSTFYNQAVFEPTEITAHSDGIRMRVQLDGLAGEETEVVLRPRHIERIIQMSADWWSTHWAQIFEEDDK